MLERMYVFYKRIEDRGLGKHDLQTKCLGMRRPLMAHQLYGMYWLHEREVPGQFMCNGTDVLAAVPGMRKSTTMATVGNLLHPGA